MGTRNYLPEQHAFPYEDQRYQRQPQRAAPQEKQTRGRAVAAPAGRVYQEPRPARHLAQPYPPASTHRAGHYGGIHPEDAPYMTVDMEPEEEDERFYSQRSHTSIRTYNQPLPPAQRTRYAIEERPELLPSIRPRRSATQAHPPVRDERETIAPRRTRSRFHLHWLAYVGIGMMAAFILWIGAGFFLSWYSTWQDDLHYGRPRTFQIDAVVGHNDSPTNPSHFIAINLNAQIVIIEIPGGDISKAMIYQAPKLYGQDAELAPVTLSFQDVNHDGKPDMLLHFQGSEIIFLNENGRFVPQH